MRLILPKAINKAWLARRIGVNRTTVTRWVAGTRSMSYDQHEMVHHELIRLASDILVYALVMQAAIDTMDELTEESF